MQVQRALARSASAVARRSARALFGLRQRGQDLGLRAPVRLEEEPPGRRAGRVALDPRRVGRQVDERERLAVEHARVPVDAHRHRDGVRQCASSGAALATPPSVQRDVVVVSGQHERARAAAPRCGARTRPRRARSARSCSPRNSPGVGQVDVAVGERRIERPAAQVDAPHAGARVRSGRSETTRPLSTTMPSNSRQLPRRRLVRVARPAGQTHTSSRPTEIPGYTCCACAARTHSPHSAALGWRAAGFTLGYAALRARAGRARPARAVPPRATTAIRAATARRGAR